MMRLTDVRKSYQGNVVLEVPEVVLPEGKLTALIGPNGAGKSTLLSVAGRLLQPDHGSVHLGDLDVLGSPSETVARRLAMLRQENQMNARLTVVELVRFGRFPHSRGRLDGRDHELVEQALGFCELTELRDRFLDQLSGGQRQRAFIAMVLAQDTEYVLLDEPLNNLDIRHGVAMMRQLRRLVSELGRTVVLVLHDVNFAAAHADHIIAMKNGRVEAQGSPAEIITPEVLGRIFDVDVTVLPGASHPVACYFS